MCISCIGFDTSGGDADLSRSAHHVALPVTTWAVYGYSGHAINLPQEIASFATSLPRLASERDVIVVRKEGAAQSHRDFKDPLHFVHYNDRLQAAARRSEIEHRTDRKK